MKTLNKIQIALRNELKDDELLLLKGGIREHNVACIIRDSQGCNIGVRFCDPSIGDCCQQCDAYVDYFWPGLGYFCDCTS